MAYVRVVSLIDEHNGRELVWIIQPSKRVQRLLSVRGDTDDIEKIFPQQTFNLKLGFLGLRHLRQKPQLRRRVVINRLRRVVHHVVLAKDTDEAYIQRIRDIVLERINQEKNLHRVPFFAITAVSPSRPQDLKFGVRELYKADVKAIKEKGLMILEEPGAVPTDSNF